MHLAIRTPANFIPLNGLIPACLWYQDYCPKRESRPHYWTGQESGPLQHSAPLPALQTLEGGTEVPLVLAVQAPCQGSPPSQCDWLANGRTQHHSTTSANYFQRINEKLIPALLLWKWFADIVKGCCVPPNNIYLPTNQHWEREEPWQGVCTASTNGTSVLRMSKARTANRESHMYGCGHQLVTNI